MYVPGALMSVRTGIDALRLVTPDNCGNHSSTIGKRMKRREQEYPSR